MTRFYTLLLLLSTFFALARFSASAQEALPSVTPTMLVTDANGEELEDVSFDGSAPAKALFKANPADLGDYTPHYEWQFIRSGESEPFLTRYDEDTEYEFSQSGTFTVKLLVSFVAGTDTLEYAMDEPFSVTISESKLEVPNAFSPNGDGINDVFKVKEGYQSIVAFKARVFNRWGKLVYEWTSPDGGWDGRQGGNDVPDGGYYLNLQARGADGRVYDIKKVINVLRGFSEQEGGSAE